MTSVLPPSASDPDDSMAEKPAGWEGAPSDYINTQPQLSLPVLVVITVSALVILGTIVAVVLSSR